MYVSWPENKILKIVFYIDPKNKKKIVKSEWIITLNDISEQLVPNDSANFTLKLVATRSGTVIVNKMVAGTVEQTDLKP